MTEAKKEIRSMIYGQYNSEKACADAMGWPKQKLNKIVNGKKEPTVSEVVKIATTLKCPVGRMAEIFLAMQSPNG